MAPPLKRTGPWAIVHGLAHPRGDDPALGESGVPNYTDAELMDLDRRRALEGIPVLFGHSERVIDGRTQGVQVGVVLSSYLRDGDLWLRMELRPDSAVGLPGAAVLASMTSTDEKAYRGLSLGSKLLRDALTDRDVLSDPDEVSICPLGDARRGSRCEIVYCEAVGETNPDESSMVPRGAGAASGDQAGRPVSVLASRDPASSGAPPSAWTLESLVPIVPALRAFLDRCAPRLVMASLPVAQPAATSTPTAAVAAPPAPAPATATGAPMATPSPPPPQPSQVQAPAATALLLQPSVAPAAPVTIPLATPAIAPGAPSGGASSSGAASPAPPAAPATNPAAQAVAPPATSAAAPASDVQAPGGLMEAMTEVHARLRQAEADRKALEEALQASQKQQLEMAETVKQAMQEKEQARVTKAKGEIMEMLEKEERDTSVVLEGSPDKPERLVRYIESLREMRKRVDEHAGRAGTLDEFNRATDVNTLKAELDKMSAVREAFVAGLSGASKVLRTVEALAARKADEAMRRTAQEQPSSGTYDMLRTNAAVEAQVREAMRQYQESLSSAVKQAVPQIAAATATATAATAAVGGAPATETSAVAPAQPLGEVMASKPGTDAPRAPADTTEQAQDSGPFLSVTPVGQIVVNPKAAPRRHGWPQMPGFDPSCAPEYEPFAGKRRPDQWDADVAASRVLVREVMAAMANPDEVITRGSRLIPSKQPGAPVVCLSGDDASLVPQDKVLYRPFSAVAGEYQNAGVMIQPLLCAGSSAGGRFPNCPVQNDVYASITRDMRRCESAYIPTQYVPRGVTEPKPTDPQFQRKSFGEHRRVLASVLRGRPRVADADGASARGASGGVDVNPAKRTLIQG